MTGERNNDDADTPVGDMTEEGQTDLGPIPELGNIGNLEQADLEAEAQVDDPPSGS
ncbi:hypothetical protein ACPPVQ_04725 [Diaminobutyricibacter sp. McL0618]|uniref:hypothetical protein n=1 Tax=Leifsonia sp. McL0618 TaxID=3415677 RepID=UPI003CFA5C9C